MNNKKLMQIKFLVSQNKFELFLGNALVSRSGFNVFQSDKWFNQKYITLFNLKTFKKFQRKGFARHLLNQIFNYVKSELEIKIIALIVLKDNYRAVNLYLSSGFEIYIEYPDSFSLIKKL
jgi:ribosomal protein S18 acetylase RimI-like enzyme